MAIHKEQRGTSEDLELVERLAEEFAERLRRGQRPSIREYADRYPEHAQIIREHEYPGVSAGCELTMAVAVETKVRVRFQELTSQWKTQSRYLSNTAQMAMLWPYQQIIGLGSSAVPLILAELRRETDHWFWALEAITGENPVPSEVAGDVEAAAAAWLRWGREKGLNA